MTPKGAKTFHLLMARKMLFVWSKVCMFENTLMTHMVKKSYFLFFYSVGELVKVFFVVFPHLVFYRLSFLKNEYHKPVASIAAAQSASKTTRDINCTKWGKV